MESLFVYGTLGPGRPNAHVLENIGGVWEKGCVGGTLVDKGWGAEMGFPGISLDNSGHQVEGFIFTSENLQTHWQALDEFEGAEYQRVPVNVTTHSGKIVSSYIYMLRAE